MAASTLGIRGLRRFMWVVFPDALPHVAQGLRVMLSLSLVVMVVTEMVMGSSQDGLGRLILDYYDKRFMPEMYASIMAVGFLGYVLNKGFQWIESRRIHWSGKR